MSLEPPDYLKWYSDEINRYRNLEWQLAGYSLAISYGSAFLIATKSNLGDLSIWAVVLVIVSVALLALAQMHTHRRLNHYRLRRNALVKDAPHLEAPSPLFDSDAKDFAFLLGFLVLPVLFAIASIGFIARVGV